MSYWTQDVFHAEQSYDLLTMQPILIYIRDLLFSSKVVATARAKGIAFQVIRDASKLLNTSADRLIADLNDPQALDTVIAWKQKYRGHVTGFCSHVATPIFQQAREAGIDQVLSNGAFSAHLDQVLSSKASDSVSTSQPPNG